MNWARRLCIPLLLLLCGCSSIEMHREQPEYSVGVVLKALNSPYWLDMKSGMEQAAADYGVDLILLYPKGEQEAEEQQNLISDMLNSDIDLLMVAPCNSYNTNWFVQQAEERDIQLLTVDTRAMDTDLPYIGSDNYLFGKMVAQYLNEQLGEDASLFMLFGPENQSSIIERYQAMRDELKDGIRIRDVQYYELSEENGYQAVQKLTEPVDAIFCQNVVIGCGAVEALTEKGWTAKVVAVDTRADAIEILQNGTMDAMVAQDGYEIGYQAIELARESMKSGQTMEDVLFGGELLTAQDVGGD